jgi:hypothetical protein
MWSKVSDDFYDHPKTMCCSLAAVGLWTCCMSYAARHKTNGKIPRNFALSRATQTEIDELVSAGLWEETDGGWQFHDWSDYQPTTYEQRKYNTGKDEKKVLAGSKGGKRAASKSTAKTQQIDSPEPEPEPINNYPSADADASPRTDVKEIIDYLDDAIRESGQKLPGRTKKNLEAARLLLDKDHRTVQQVKNCVDFTFQDEFWRTNIRSMSKLREKWVQLEGAAARAKTRMKPAVPAPENDPYAWMRVVSS